MESDVQYPLGKSGTDGQISDHENFRMSGKAQIGFHQNPSTRLQLGAGGLGKSLAKKGKLELPPTKSQCDKEWGVSAAGCRLANYAGKPACIVFELCRNPGYEPETPTAKRQDGDLAPGNHGGCASRRV